MRLSRALLLVLLVAGFFASLPSTASAAETYDLKPYGTKCVSGQTDERKYLYLVCQNALNEGWLRVVRPDGTIESQARVPGANDVAPAPDGSYVYVSGGGAYPLRRWDRQLDGTYAENRDWRPPTFRMWGVDQPSKGRQIATDGYGNLYVANGVWTTELLHVVVKFDSNGRYVTQFGGYRNTWDWGTFYNLSGISVSRDGRYIYTTEVANSRAQRFDQQPDGSYAWGRGFGNNAVTDPYRLGMCAPGLMAAPYDVAVDAWGDVWVGSTSCTYMEKFDKDGNVLFTSFVGNRGTLRPGVNADGSQQRLHNIAVDWRGDAIAGETSTWLVRSGEIPAWPVLATQPAPAPVPVPVPAPAPAPGDVAAPVVNQVTLPATTAVSVVDVVINATDDRGVTQVRLATENGNWGAWQAFLPTIHFTLTAGLGYRGVYVQVRDAAGKESNVVYRTTRVVDAPAPAPVPDPAPAPEPAPAPAPVPAPAPAPAPAPGPDATAPTLRALTIPATTITSQIDVVIDAIDDRGVVQVRLATEDGNWGPWQPFLPTMRFTLTPGLGFRGVYAQVRDAAGNESASLYRITRVNAA